MDNLWQKKVKVVPVVIGSLGAIPKCPEEYLSSIGSTEITISQLHMYCALGLHPWRLLSGSHKATSANAWCRPTGGVAKVASYAPADGRRSAGPGQSAQGFGGRWLNMVGSEPNGVVME